MILHTAIILHGTLGSPQSNWFQWLKNELEARGMEVWLPELPQAEQPSLREEADFVRGNCPFAIDESTLIVGHSSGAILALILAQENGSPIGAVAAISVFHDNSLQWEPNSKLFDVDFDWPNIRQNAKQLLFVHSDDDPYVPLEQAHYVAEKCDSELMVLPGQGHFNLEKSESYRQFPKLLEIIEQNKLVPAKLKIFTYDGNPKPVHFMETMQVKEGVECDVYAFTNDTTQDLGIIKIRKGYSSPRQRVLKGDTTTEGFISGTAKLRVQHKDGTMDTYSYDGANAADPVTIKVGEIMEWQALDDLVYYEICQPPYEDGRYEDL